MQLCGRVERIKEKFKRIKKDGNIKNGVLIGAQNRGHHEGFPTIGNRV